MSLLAWPAMLTVVVTYWYLARSGNALPFHEANVLAAVVLGIVNVRAGVYPQAILNAVFGLVGASALYRRATRT